MDSVLGEGSCFGFQLSIDCVGSPEPEKIAIPETIKTVLIIDDLPINRMILEKQLSVIGLRVTTHRSVSAALNDDPGRFDLILADGDLAELDGIGLAERLQELGCRNPLILFTSNPGPLNQRKEEMGIHGVVQKPMLRRDLMMRLRGLESFEPAAARPSRKRRLRPRSKPRECVSSRQRTTRPTSSCSPKWSRPSIWT